jgi:Flp pilus assembly protein TadD
MRFLKGLFGASDGPDRVDYYEEGLVLLREGKFHDALTSLRLALREAPGDLAVLQQIAITYTRIGMTDEAIRTYRSVLEKDADAPGAHYGMAFLLLRKDENEEAVHHLKAFLAHPPRGGEAQAHVQHARATLARLVGADDDADGRSSSDLGIDHG